MVLLLPSVKQGSVTEYVYIYVKVFWYFLCHMGVWMLTLYQQRRMVLVTGKVTCDKSMITDGRSIYLLD